MPLFLSGTSHETVVVRAVTSETRMAVNPSGAASSVVAATAELLVQRSPSTQVTNVKFCCVAGNNDSTMALVSVPR